MKIEVIIVDSINERTTGATCFNVDPIISQVIRNQKPFQGIVIIDGVAVKFSFSCAGMDGDIFSTNTKHRTIVKHIVPLYAFNKSTILGE